MKRDAYVHHYFSPTVGWLELQVSDRGVRSISFVEPPRSPARRVDGPVMPGLIQELDQYFRGVPVIFSLPLAPDGGSSFQRRVWEELRRIPWGQTRSYGEIAQAVGKPGAARAVGGANGANEIPILIPCHRVIKADGSLGGYASGTDVKRKLLELEGVRV